MLLPCLFDATAAIPSAHPAAGPFTLVATANDPAKAYLRCPAGSFLRAAERAEAEAVLVALHLRRKALCWAVLPSEAGDTYATRGFAEWNSGTTLKPP